MFLAYGYVRLVGGSKYASETNAYSLAFIVFFEIEGAFLKSAKIGHKF